MSRKEVPDEEHPAFGMISVNRCQGTPRTLFDSEIQHSHTVRLTITRAIRRRMLNRDWLHGTRDLIEIEMSEAQWASHVASMGIGSGTACTLRRVEAEDGSGYAPTPDLPYEPRMEQSLGEVRGAVDALLTDIKDALAAYEASKTVKNLRALHSTIENASGNAAYAAKSLSEHAENTVSKARADVEAMVLQAAHAVGLDPKTIGTGTKHLEVGQ